MADKKKKEDKEIEIKIKESQLPLVRGSLDDTIANIAQAIRQQRDEKERGGMRKVMEDYQIIQKLFADEASSGS